MDNIEFMLIGFISGLYCLFYICRKINRNKLNEEQIRKAIRKSIIDDLNNPHQFDDINIPTYEMFIDECITYLYKKISKTIPNNSLGLHILDDELHTTRVYNSLIDIYLANITETIKRANKYEDEAIEYHSIFGEEPDGEPTLHPKTKNNGSSIQPEKYPSIQDLIKTGTIEDL